MDSPLDMPTGTTTALRPDDVEILKNEFPDGGTISSVHSPDKAVFWVEAHYEDQLLKSMRSHGIGGPIASMLSPDIPALTIFGSFLDKSVVQAAQLLADGSRFMVMLRPTMDDPVPKWEQNPVADYSMIDALDEHPGHFVSGDNHNKDSQPAHEETIDSDNSSTTGAGQTDSAKKIGMALRLRGGADEDECSPWLGPIHKSALNITVCPGVGVTHDIWLLSQIQFKLQTEYTDSRRSKPRPQLVSWTRFSSKSESRGVRTDRSYSASGFVVYGHSIFDCESIPCADFTPPNQTTKVTNINTDQNTYTANIVGGVNSIGGLAYAKNKIKTNAVENMNDRVTPKCAVYAGQGNRWNAKKENDASFNSMIFSYQPASIFQEDDQQHPMEVEFSMGITTMSSGIPESASFIARNQTNLWIPNNQLRAKGQGMVVASSAYIPDIHAIRPLNIEENTTVELAGSSLTNLPAAKKTSEYDAALSLSIGLLDQKHPNDKPGFLRKLTNKLSDISLSRRNPIPNASIETVRLHEYIARGWDASLDQWRLPIYPTLDRNFRPGATSSWKLEVTDERGKVLVDPEYKGPRPAPLNRAGEKALQAPGVSAGPLQLGTATTSQISFVTGESSAGSGTVPSVISTQATSIEVAASSPRATSISGQVTAAHDVTTKAGPSSSKGKGKAPEISQT
ncbi:hypothetical protein C8J57DRAFT_181467 [Mycena rebaudengoi]|nr:hypothetical protein C8J57DRAFT_181467 [Mycena rebaudengoi]